MARRDARQLDHKTLEEIRIRVVEQVQAGESPEAVIQALGFSRSCIYTWAGVVSVRRVGCAEGAGVVRPTDEGFARPNEVGVRNRHGKQPAAVPV